MAKDYKWELAVVLIWRCVNPDFDLWRDLLVTFSTMLALHARGMSNFWITDVFVFRDLLLAASYQIQLVLC